ncbi:helitron helicase-like domain-containing protein [Artemisia annua]|uniref:Helitron helicase-like domain-containing protein n=1 Tax=Artemisia annua TaxID=35608 RepID=A0A2U1LK29_ARTAN|nr:helitron helicase-like domain-containing protein [Artemisia annua]
MKTKRKAIRRVPSFSGLDCAPSFDDGKGIDSFSVEVTAKKRVRHNSTIDTPKLSVNKKLCYSYPIAASPAIDNFGVLSTNGHPSGSSHAPADQSIAEHTGQASENSIAQYQLYEEFTCDGDNNQCESDHTSTNLSQHSARYQKVSSVHDVPELNITQGHRLDHCNRRLAYCNERSSDPTQYESQSTHVHSRSYHQQGRMHSIPRRRQRRRGTTNQRRPSRQGPPEIYIHMGQCNNVCHHCNARFWYDERIKHTNGRIEYHRCCNAGKVRLDTHADYPEFIKELFTDRHFMESVRAYNQMFAMTSLGAEIDDTVNRGRVRMCLKFQAKYTIG